MKLPESLLINSNAPNSSPDAAAQRHAQEGLGSVAEPGVDLVVDRVGIDGDVDAARLAALDHLADDAAVVGDPQFVVFDAQGRPADEGVAGAVPEEDACPIGAEQPRGRLGHLGQQRFHLVALVPPLGDLDDGFEPPEPLRLPLKLLLSADDGGQLLAHQGRQVFEHGQGARRLGLRRCEAE